MKTISKGAGSAWPYGVPSNAKISLLPRQSLHNAMAQWMFWKGNDTVFSRLVKEKCWSFCLMTLCVPVSLEKLTLREAHTLLYKAQEETSV